MENGGAFQPITVFHSQTGTPLDENNIRRCLNSALKTAKIHDLHFHDLRHTFATRMVQAGVDLYKSAAIAGA
ncbi:MAG: tyrosine-type recombinase/integrase [Nitrospira sp.]